MDNFFAPFPPGRCVLDKVSSHIQKSELVYNNFFSISVTSVWHVVIDGRFSLPWWVQVCLAMRCNHNGFADFRCVKPVVFLMLLE